MSAVCAHRQNLVTAAHQDYVFARYLTEGHRSIGKIANGKSISEITFLSFFPSAMSVPDFIVISNLD